MIDNNIKSNISQGEELEELIAQLTQNGMQIKIDKMILTISIMLMQYLKEKSFHFHILVKRGLIVSFVK